jgi:hypothetical protein
MFTAIYGNGPKLSVDFRQTFFYYDFDNDIRVYGLCM